MNHYTTNPYERMPIHSIQRLSPAAVLGLWHLTEAAADLWPLLPQPTAYHKLRPATADATRQAQWLGGRVLVHRLAAEFDTLQADTLTVQNDPTGRPWLAEAGPGVEISLSHSGAWVAAVLAIGGRVGVDVEIVRGKAQRIASRFLASSEARAAEEIALAAPALASAHYSLLWSAKETLYKLAAERGIIFRKQLLLHSFAPQPSGQIPATLVVGAVETRHCICYYQPAPGYVLTYCHEPTA